MFRSIEDFVKVRDAMWDNPEWIDEFLFENDKGEFTERDLTIIANWLKYFIKDRFIVVNHLSKYTILMNTDGEPAYLYKVKGIFDPLEYSFK